MIAAAAATTIGVIVWYWSSKMNDGSNSGKRLSAIWSLNLRIIRLNVPPLSTLPSAMRA